MLCTVYNVGVFLPQLLPETYHEIYIENNGVQIHQQINFHMLFFPFWFSLAKISSSFSSQCVQFFSTVCYQPAIMYLGINIQKKNNINSYIKNAESEWKNRKKMSSKSIRLFSIAQKATTDREKTGNSIRLLVYTYIPTINAIHWSDIFEKTWTLQYTINMFILCIYLQNLFVEVGCASVFGESRFDIFDCFWL